MARSSAGVSVVIVVGSGGVVGRRSRGLAELWNAELVLKGVDG